MLTIVPTFPLTSRAPLCLPPPPHGPDMPPRRNAPVRGEPVLSGRLRPPDRPADPRAPARVSAGPEALSATGHDPAAEYKRPVTHGGPNISIKSSSRLPGPEWSRAPEPLSLRASRPLGVASGCAHESFTSNDTRRGRGSGGPRPGGGEDSKGDNTRNSAIPRNVPVGALFPDRRTPLPSIPEYKHPVTFLLPRHQRPSRGLTAPGGI